MFLWKRHRDLIGGWGFWFDWSIGNGVLGFFVGLLPLYGADINKGIFNVKHAIIFAVIAVLGNALAFGIGVMINRDSRGHSYFIVRGEILGFMKDEQLRKHLPRMFSLIKNESWGLEDDQIPS